MRIATVKVKGHGDVVVTSAVDEAENLRMVPISGAATLEQWRTDKSLLPPWLLPNDLEPGQDWGAIVSTLGDERE